VAYVICNEACLKVKDVDNKFEIHFILSIFELLNLRLFWISATGSSAFCIKCHAILLHSASGCEAFSNDSLEVRWQAVRDPCYRHPAGNFRLFAGSGLRHYRSCWLAEERETFSLSLDCIDIFSDRETRHCLLEEKVRT
jgi:hypothetical protein